MQINVFPITLQ